MTTADEEQLSPAERRDAAIWRILRAAYLRVVCSYVQREPASLTVEEANGFLDPWFAALEHDRRLLAEVVESARIDGIDVVHGAVHAMPRIEHDVLDEAVEWARETGKPERDPE